MHEASPATATFLFTDVEGSTELLKLLRGDYAAVLSEHHLILRESFGAFGGVEVDNQGDSFFVAFKQAKDAVLAAAQSQRALAEHTWPGGASVRVRMGIHTGEAQLASERYVGLSVHRAARISALAHGGQVLVSPTTAGLLEDEEDLPGVKLRDLGDYWLKDIARPVRLHELEIDGLQTKFPPLKPSGAPPVQRRRKRMLTVAAAVVAGVAAALAFALTRGHAAPPRIVANSLVRIDPKTLAPTDVVPIDAAPDLMVASGGYVWITHHILRNTNNKEIRNAGDRTLTRVDPASGDVVTVGGGLAPCGLTADPSGDVWVANCYVGRGLPSNVVRVDAKTREFEKTSPLPRGKGIYRGLTYGGGSLWASVENPPHPPHLIVRIDPQSGRQRLVRIPLPGGPLAWSGDYGDLWVSGFDVGALTRIHAATGEVDTMQALAENPAVLLVAGDTVWIADWSNGRLEGQPAVGSGAPSLTVLPTRKQGPGSVNLAGRLLVAVAVPATCRPALKRAFVALGKPSLLRRRPVEPAVGRHRPLEILPAKARKIDIPRRRRVP